MREDMLIRIASLHHRPDRLLMSRENPDLSCLSPFSIANIDDQTLFTSPIHLTYKKRCSFFTAQATGT
jgi:hypothetical protein